MLCQGYFVWAAIVVLIGTVASAAKGADARSQSNSVTLLTVFMLNGQLSVIGPPADTKGTCKLLWTAPVSSSVKTRAIPDLQTPWDNTWLSSQGDLYYIDVVGETLVSASTFAINLVLPIKDVTAGKSLAPRQLPASSIGDMGFLNGIYSNGKAKFYFCFSMIDRTAECWGTISGKLKRESLVGEKWSEHAPYQIAITCPFQVFQVGSQIILLSNDRKCYLVNEKTLDLMGTIADGQATTKPASAATETVSGRSHNGKDNADVATLPSVGNMIILYDPKAMKCALLEWNDKQIHSLKVAYKSKDMEKLDVASLNPGKQDLKSLTALLTERDKLVKQYQKALIEAASKPAADSPTDKKGNAP